MFNEIGLRMAILLLFAIKIFTWLLDSEIAWFVERITMCKAFIPHSQQCQSRGLCIIWMCWTTNAQWTWGTNPLGAKITKNKRPIQQDRKRNLPKGLVFLVLALILWGAWIPSEVSVDFPWLLEDKVILCFWKSHLPVRQLINTTTAKTKQKHELHLCFHTSDHQAVLHAAALPPAAASSSRTQLPDTYPAHRPPSHSGQGFKSTERQKVIENSQRPRTEFQSRPRHTAQLAQPSPQGQLGELQPERLHTQHQRVRHLSCRATSFQQLGELFLLNVS